MESKTPDTIAGEAQSSRGSGIREALGRLAIVLAGIFLTQVVLYGPSLIGSKILLPIDILARPGVYLPQTPEARKVLVHDQIMSDMIFQLEPMRQFVGSELRAGRLPIWTPFEFCGAPNYRTPLCPAWLLNYLFESPVVLAWSQVLLSMVAGVGAYLYFRRSLHVGFWPAAVVAWCFPISGTFIVWQGCGSPPVVAWLPWMLVSVDQAIQRPRSWGGPALAVFTVFAIISAAPDVAGQVLLTTGLYAVWRFIAHYRRLGFKRDSAIAFASVTVGWALGILMSLPLLLPMLEYSQTGLRMMNRGSGSEERPPVGLEALPQIVLPEMYGLTQAGSLRIVSGNRPESSVGAYAGLIATLLVAPLAWLSRRHRSLLIVWTLLGFLGLSWALNVPILVDLLRMPGLNMMSHNRFVFATSFAILTMAAIGLDLLLRGEVSRRNWLWVPAGVLVILLGWCAYRTMYLPEPLATQLPDAVLNKGQVLANNPAPNAIFEVQANFRLSYGVATVLSAIALAGWLILWSRTKLTRLSGRIFAALMIVELLWFAYGVNAQCEPWMYYPRIPALQEVAKAAPGRAIGYGCLASNLLRTHSLRDVRGYDAVDPFRMVQILSLAAADTSTVVSYTATQYLVPKIQAAPPDQLRLHPVMDLLGVRYVVFRGSPPDGFQPAFRSEDYWVLSNQSALPRVFIPKRVETVADGQSRLLKMGAAGFDPREVAFVEEPVAFSAACEGSAKIDAEVPTHLTVSLQMKTPGLVILSDLWDVGWNAYLDGRQVPILRADHALRGVAAPAGNSVLEFRYEPASLRRGLQLAAGAAILLLAWMVARYVRRNRVPDAVAAAS